MILALFIAAAAPSVPARLDCLVGDDAEPAASLPAGADEPSPLTIAIRQRGQRLEPVVIEGPPLFSSFEGLRSFSGTPQRDGSLAVSESRQPARALQWRGRLRDGAIELRRPGMRITLRPDPSSPGSYSGNWNMNTLLEGHILMNGGGPVTCTSASAAPQGAGA